MLLKKVVITFNDEFKDFDLFMNVMELMAYNGYIENIEEINPTPAYKKGRSIKIIAIDVDTKEQLEFESIKQAGVALNIHQGRISKYLNTNESVDGYYFKQAYEKQLKIK